MGQDELCIWDTIPGVFYKGEVGGVPGNWRGRLPFLELRLEGCFSVSSFLFVQGLERFSCFSMFLSGLWLHVWMCNVVWIYFLLCLIPALVAVTTAVTAG
jgi:hypothetical protein